MKNVHDFCLVIILSKYMILLCHLFIINYLNNGSFVLSLKILKG